MIILTESVHLPNGTYGSKRWRIPWYVGVPVLVILWLVTMLASGVTVWWCMKEYLYL